MSKVVWTNSHNLWQYFLSACKLNICCLQIWFSDESIIMLCREVVVIALFKESVVTVRFIWGLRYGICIDRWFSLVWCPHTWVVFENWHSWSAGIIVVTLGKAGFVCARRFCDLGMAKVFHTPPKSVGRSGVSLRFDRCPLKDHVSPEPFRKTPRSKTPKKQVSRLRILSNGTFEHIQA